MLPNQTTKNLPKVFSDFKKHILCFCYVLLSKSTFSHNKPLSYPLPWEPIKFCCNGLQSGSDTSENTECNNNSSIERGPSGPPEYKRLIAIHAGKPKGTLKEALKVEEDKLRRLSLSEQALEKATASHGTDVVRYFLMKLKQYSHNTLYLYLCIFFWYVSFFLFSFSHLLKIVLEMSIYRFTQKNFLRIYPKGTRFDSSNYKPLIGWMHGAQMVAFNMQVV